MIPDTLDEEITPAQSYGLLELIDRDKTDIDQSDGDDDYFEDCAEMFPGDAGELYNPLGL